MPNVFRNPGVYIPEIKSTGKTITGVSTSITLLIGTFPKGPRFTPTRIRSLRDFAGTFGRPVNNHLPFLVITQFFENGWNDI